MPEIPLTRRAALPALLMFAALIAARPARADDPSSANSNSAPSVDSSDQPYDPAADANGDGTVTKREARRYRRSQRGGVKKSGSSASGSDAPDDGAAAAAAGARGAAALGAASSDASALKNSLPSADAGNMPGGPGGSKGFNGGPGGGVGGGGSGVKGGGSVSVASPGGAGTNGSSGDPSNPRSPADFALAARSGYAPAFASAGLKLSADGRGVVRLDGSPATADDLARLRRGILQMPAALTRRPDFFSQISPQRYSDLKSGYSEHPEMSRTVYKDVGETPDQRDFVHTASCAKVSGDCNASVEKSSYKKGDFVAPEDLDRMWDALQKEIDSTAKGSDSASNGGDAGVHAPKIALPEDGSASFDGVAGVGGGGASAVSVGGGGAKGAAASAPTAVAATAKRAWGATMAALGFGGPGARGRPNGFVLVLCALGALATFGLAIALFRKR